MTVSQEDFDALSSSVAALRRELADMTDRMSDHVGLDYGATGINYPHPNQSIETAEFGGAIMRLDRIGMQVKEGSGSPYGALFFVDEFLTERPVSTSEDVAAVYGYNSTATALQGVVMHAGDPLEGTEVEYAQVKAESDGGDNFVQLKAADSAQIEAEVLVSPAGTASNYVQLRATDTGATNQNVTLGVWNGTDGRFVIISGAPLLIPTKAGGFTFANDGEIDYDTTADKMRLRQNGSTVNIATEGYVDTHTSDTSDAHDASAISILDTAGDFTATDVEGALAELQADAEAHVAAADPHTGYLKEADIAAKGDLFAGTADNTVGILTVGATNGHVLTVDSGQTTGMKWAAAGGGGMKKVTGSGYQVYPSAADGVTPANAASVWANGAYSQIVASTAAAIYITHIMFGVDGSSQEVEIDIATGGAGAETVVSTVCYSIPSTTDVSVMIPLPFVVAVATSTRIAVRMRESGTTTVVEDVKVMYVAQSAVADL